LRQQVRILQRKAKTTPRITDPERMVLATLTDKYKRAKTGVHQRLNQVIMIFKPETVLRWHRERVRRKWTFKRKRQPGRPGTSAEVEALIVRLAKENASWGYERIQGELLKLGHTVCPSTVGNVLKRHGITPASERSSSSWRKFLGHYKDQMLACDFFTVETKASPLGIGLKTIYVLFFIELGTRRVRLAGCTANPDTTWVTQQARQLIWELEDESQVKTYLIRDNDKKFPAAFDTVFTSNGIEIVNTPYQAPRANSFAERCVRSARQECLDQLLIVNELHLRRVLQEYIAYTILTHVTQ
jgi:putative transposase